jgi:hypothetical protein
MLAATLSNENAFDRCIIIKLRIKEIILANAYLEFTLAKDLVFKTNFAYDKFYSIRTYMQTMK